MFAGKANKKKSLMKKSLIITTAALCVGNWRRRISTNFRPILVGMALACVAVLGAPRMASALTHAWYPLSLRQCYFYNQGNIK